MTIGNAKYDLFLLEDSKINSRTDFNFETSKEQRFEMLQVWFMSFKEF